jgi:hypothetical protein
MASAAATASAGWANTEKWNLPRPRFAPACEPIVIDPLAAAKGSGYDRLSGS